uniref:Uncharacterized protein n=1 Tax=Cyprinus carpio TaxID=7962 RepID=A0A8C1JQU4_CYPCA
MQLHGHQYPCTLLTILDYLTFLRFLPDRIFCFCDERHPELCFEAIIYHDCMSVRIKIKMRLKYEFGFGSPP